MGGLNPVGGTSRCHATCWPRSPPTISPTTAAGESIGRSQPQTRTARGCTFASSRAGSSLCWALAVRARRLGVAVDGRSRRIVTVGPHRLYELVHLARPGDHLLTLTFQQGIEAYAFTFG